MQGLHHRLEFAERAGRAVTRLGREEADGVVAPVVVQPHFDEALVVDERVHGQELDGGDAETAQVIEHRRRREPGIGAAKLRRHIGVKLGEALDVQLVDHRILPRRARWCVVVPGESGIDDPALRHSRRAVARVERKILALVPDAVAEVRIAPPHLADDLARVRVEQQLVRVEAVALLGCIRTVHSVAVQHAGPRLRQVAVPHEVGALGHVDALDFAPTLRVEDAELHALGVLGVEREVDAFAVPGRAEGRGRSAPHRRNASKRARRRFHRPRLGPRGGVSTGGSSTGSCVRDQRSRNCAARFCPPSPNASASASATAPRMIRNAWRMMSPSPS